MNPPPTHLEGLSVRRHLDHPVFSDRNLMRKALKDVRSAPNATTYFIPWLGMTSGEFAVCRLIKKWKLDQLKKGR